MSLTYEERNAVAVIRKAMRNKPEIVNEIFKDQAYSQAYELLKLAKTQLDQLLEVNRAFISAASVLAKKQKDAEAHHADN